MSILSYAQLDERSSGIRSMTSQCQVPAGCNDISAMIGRARQYGYVSEDIAFEEMILNGILEAERLSEVRAESKYPPPLTQFSTLE
ncbi:MAG TPA: hypothetical protein VN455_11045 [Methanotrichaceae archaeon]|nr:hypothetical protein [Methanotrichaceae archaeon]